MFIPLSDLRWFVILMFLSGLFWGTLLDMIRFLLTGEKDGYVRDIHAVLMFLKCRLFRLS